MTSKNNSFSTSRSFSLSNSIVSPIRNFVFRYRVILSMVIVTLVFSWLGFHFGDRYGLLVGFFSAAGLISLILLYVERRLANIFPRNELEGVDPYGILRTVRDEANARGLRTPPVFIVDLETPTAFSAGLFTRDAKLYLSRGLVHRLSSEETRLVIAYELERMKREQTQSITALASLASLFATVANAVDSLLLLPFGPRRQELRPYGPMTLFTSPLVAAFLRFGFSRSAIIEADHAVGTSKSPEEWARLLWKLDAYNKTLPLDVNLAEASLFTVNPLSRLGWLRFTSAQPEIETRVRELTGRYPL